MYYIIMHGNMNINLAFTRLTTTNVSTASASFCTGRCGVVWCGVVWQCLRFVFSAFIVRTELKEIQRKECFPICGPWQRYRIQFEHIISND